MRYKVLGNGETILHECDSWSEAVGWLERYLNGGDGGYDWFALTRDDEVRAKYMINKDCGVGDESE